MGTGTIILRVLVVMRAGGGTAALVQAPDGRWRLLELD